jgi:hypothetical protein
MEIKRITFEEFANIHRDELNAHIDGGNVYIVTKAMPVDDVMRVRLEVQALARSSDGLWHPPGAESENNYRAIDEDPRSHVLQKCDRAIFYLWREDSQHIARLVMPVCELKRKMLGFPDTKFVYNNPGSGIFSQVAVNHYPLGGGHMMSHLDPDQSVNGAQTIVNGSIRGQDYRSGGLFLIDKSRDRKVGVEDHWEIGDVLCFDASCIAHGVDPVDPDEKISWSLDRGRFTITPVMIRVSQDGSVAPSKATA